MPPVNTPTVSSPSARTPPRLQTPNAGRPLTPLSYLSSPAPDLAATLHTSHAADEADEANVNFLRDSLDSLNSLDSQSQSSSRRARVDAQRDPRLVYSGDARPTMPVDPISDSSEDLSRRERLQRVLARLNRLHEPATSSASAYSNRTPSPNRQDIYDWAPGGEGTGAEESELDAILQELRRQQPDTHPDILRVLGQSQLDVNRHRERDAAGDTTNGVATDTESRRSLLRERERRRRDTEWLNLRNRAVVQRARQEGGGSPSATERMLRYVMERERSGMSEEEERARGTGWFRPNPSRAGNGIEERRSSTSSRDPRLVSFPTSDLRERDRQERVDAFRRGYLAESAAPPRLPRVSTPPVPPIEPRAKTQTSLAGRALGYLSDLRSCTRYEDSLSAAIEHGLATKEFFAEKHDDFPMDVDELPEIPRSSWLHPGAVFEGHQHATTAVTSLTHQGSSSQPRVEQINPHYQGMTMGFEHPPGSTSIRPYDPTRPWLSHHPPAHLLSPKEPHDHWPVRVTLHTIDMENMMVQGTMEAYDVPQHPASLSILNSSDRPKAGKKDKPITTYLEGHIIDLRTHSFLTPDERDNKKRKIGPYETSTENRTPYTTQSSPITFPSANAQTDAQNWLKLEPFLSMTAKATTRPNYSSPEDALARKLLSKHSLEELFTEYIFMRWKEKCFVHGKNDPCSANAADRSSDQDRGHGLTISGFYYVSLRRSDGKVEGLYFDPTTTLYQILRLNGRSGLYGAWAFR